MSRQGITFELVHNLKRWPVSIEKWEKNHGFKKTEQYLQKNMKTLKYPGTSSSSVKSTKKG